MNYRERLTIDPRVRTGKPCIRGTRIAVADVLEIIDLITTHEQDIRAPNAAPFESVLVLT
jgi:uncharacterized protein (DUF433 family)